MYVSYTDVEIELEPSDEEFTDRVGKLKTHLKVAKYILVFFYYCCECIDENRAQSHGVTG